MSTAPELVPGRFEIDEEGRPWLRASRCESCRRIAFPARTVCPRCVRPSMAPLRLGQRATLFSFTACQAAPTGWQAPYLQAYVELPEGIRVFTLISGEVEARTDALTVGMPMELVVEPVGGEGGPLTYKFRPAREDGGDA